MEAPGAEYEVVRASVGAHVHIFMDMSQTRFEIICLSKGIFITNFSLDNIITNFDYHKTDVGNDICNMTK